MSIQTVRSISLYPVAINKGEPVTVEWLLSYINAHVRLTNQRPKIIYMTQDQRNAIASELVDSLLYSNDNHQEESFDGVPIRII